MAKSNHVRVGEALELLNKGLCPFVERGIRVPTSHRVLQAHLHHRRITEAP